MRTVLSLTASFPGVADLVAANNRLRCAQNCVLILKRRVQPAVPCGWSRRGRRIGIHPLGVLAAAWGRHRDKFHKNYGNRHRSAPDPECNRDSMQEPPNCLSPTNILRPRQHSWRAVLAILAASFLSIFPGPGIPVAEAQTSSSIIVEGNRRIETETIRSYVHLGPGGQLDPAKADAALKALYETGLFRDVSIKRSGGRIIIVVAENPVIDKVAFEGNNAIKEQQLTDEIQSKSQRPFSRATVQSDVQRIVELYRHAGRYDVRVDPQTIERSDNRLDLVFRITEGDKTSVKKIVFVGNHAFGDRQLKDAIKTKEWNFMSWFTNTDIYDPDRLEVDREQIRRFYLKNGYADIRIPSAVGEFDQTTKGFVITFTVEEGARYQFGAVDIRSNVPRVSAEPLRSLVRTTPGTAYNADTVQSTVEDITREVAKRGYPFALVQPHADRDFEHKTIGVVYLIDNGPRVYIERINIRGNVRTRDDVIRRELDIAEGDAYNRALVDKAERRLKNLDLFKSVKFANEPGSAADKVVVNVNVEEKQTGDFWISGGYSTTEGPIGQVTLSDRNLWGTGLSGKATLTLGEYTRGFVFAFVDPYFLDNRLSFGVDVFDNQNLESPTQSYGSDTYGATFRFGAPLTDEVSGQLRYSIFNQSVSLAPSLLNCTPATAPPGGCASLPIQQAALNGPLWVSMIGYTAGFNNLDNNQNPTSGVRAAVNQDFAGLGGDAQFVKTTTDVRDYQPLGNDVVAMTRVQDGYVTGWGGQQVPLLDTFFGGPQFVRGFAVNGFGPRDLTPGTTMDNIGGTSYWATTEELQAPVPFIPSDAGLKVALFADAGNVWNYRGPTSFNGQSILLPSSSLIRSSIGTGLIWSSPLGPLRVDYAFPLTKAPYDILQPFRFSAGAF
jgi:outer membrane protein insertion porin family